MRRLTLMLTTVALTGAAFAAPTDVAAPGAGAVPVRTGLTIRALVDKTKALPDDTVTVTLVCRNLGPVAETGVRVEQPVAVGLEFQPQPLAPGARYDAATRRLLWSPPALAAQDETSLSFQAKVVAAEPGTALGSAPLVQSPTTPARSGEAAVTEVVSVPLLAAFALPDVMLAQQPAGRPLIDVGGAPGQALVERLTALGVVTGFPDGTFKPKSAVSRAQATKMIVATSQLAGLRDRVNLTVALARNANVGIVISNAAGQPVRKLAEDWALPAGTHNIVWDGRTDGGEAVGLGVYRYEVRAVDAASVEQKLDGTVNVVTVQPLPTDLRSSFRDVPRSAWYAPYVAEAEARGIVKGYPGRTFGPSVSISRVENTVMLVRAAGLEAEAQKRMNEALGVADAANVPKWAVGYVAVAAAQSNDGDGHLFLVGYGENKFLPDQTLTRGEAAFLLERLLDHQAPSPVPTSGRVARGHSVSFNGTPVTLSDGGRFRQRLTVAATSPTLSVAAR